MVYQQTCIRANLHVTCTAKKHRHRFQQSLQAVPLLEACLMIWGMQKSADKPSVFSSLRTERNSEHRQALAREIRQCSLNNFNVGVLVCCISRTNYKQNQEPQGRLSGSFSRFQSTPLGSWHCRLLEGLKAAGKTMAPPPPPKKVREELQETPSETHLHVTALASPPMPRGRWHRPSPKV